MRRRRQDPDAKDQAQEDALSSTAEEASPTAHPAWSEKAKAEVKFQKARSQGLDGARRFPGVRVDDSILEPSYELGPGGTIEGDSGFKRTGAFCKAWSNPQQRRILRPAVFRV